MSRLSTYLIQYPQRINEIEEEEGFHWPFFTPTDRPRPDIPWANHADSVSSDSDEDAPYHDLSAETRENLLKFLTARMNHLSAYSIGDIHRRLRQPLDKGPDALAHYLNRDNTWNALAYVCVDLNRLPAGLPKITKEHLIHQLVRWVTFVLIFD